MQSQELEESLTSKGLGVVWEGSLEKGVFRYQNLGTEKDVNVQKLQKMEFSKKDSFCASPVGRRRRLNKRSPEEIMGRAIVRGLALERKLGKEEKRCERKGWENRSIPVS